MKDNDVFKLSSTWWKAEKPKTLSDSGLGAAIEKLEALEKAPELDATRLKARLATIQLIRSLVKKVGDACVSGVHGATKKVLQSDATHKLLEAKEKSITDVEYSRGG
jgi:hypothetical protein